MTRRIIEFGFRVSCCLLLVSGTLCASEHRETPAVRAIKRTRPAVVNIHSEKTSQEESSLFSSGRNRKFNGMGTGIVVDERGYIVTNYHVVADVDALRVTLHDDSMYTAQVISYDRVQDLAIIKINPKQPLQVMPMGTSSDLMLAETVIAIGNAFGYEDSVTAGIISSLSRDVEVNEKQSYKNLIQTDASINPGNSGGPLVNLDGEVVGINVAIRAGAQRIGFAIPIDQARRIVAKLLNVEQLSNAYHGLTTVDVKAGPERYLRVDGFAPGSPAAQAGFQPGDIVIKAGKIDVVDAADLERSLLGEVAGSGVDVVVRRGDEEVALKMALAEFQPTRGKATIVARGNAETIAEKAWRTLGVRLAPVQNAQLQLTEPRYKGGLRVDQVRSESPAARNGIRQGDVLVGLHVWETANYENLEYIMEHPDFVKFRPLKFYILRGNETLYSYLNLNSDAATR